MANYRSIFLCFVIILLQAPSTLQLELVRYDWNLYVRIFNTTPHRLAFKPTESSPKAVISIKNVTDAISDAGYEIMSLILHHQLASLVPYNDGSDKNTVTIYNKKTIIIFVPPDETIDLHWGASLEHHVVLSKVDGEEFHWVCLSRGSELVTADNLFKILVVTDSGASGSGFASVNGVNITNLDIYNDGHLIVHGVERFLNSGAKVEFTHLGELNEPGTVDY